MSKFASHCTFTGLLLTSTIIAAAPAKADFTAQEVFDAMTRTLKESGAAVSAQEVSMEGGATVIAKGVTFGSGDEAFTLQEMIITDIEEPQDGNYILGEIRIPGSAIQTEDEVTVTLGDAVVRDFQVIANPSPDLYDGYYTFASIDGLTVSSEGLQFLSVDAVEQTMSPWAPDATLASNITISNINLPVALIQDPRSRAAMTAMGYETISMDMIATGSWTPQTGKTELSDMTLAAKDMADLSMTLALDGYTLELAESLRELAGSMTPENEQAMGMAMLGVFQQLDVRGATITLKDQSLTGRLLDFIGEQQGMDRAGITAMAKGILPIGLAQIGDPDFAQQAQAAISAYLDNPDKLTITAAPEAPVPFAVLMGGAMGGDPASLLKTLNVSIQAN